MKRTDDIVHSNMLALYTQGTGFNPQEGRKEGRKTKEEREKA